MPASSQWRQFDPPLHKAESGLQAHRACRAPFLDRMERTKRSVPGVRKWLRFEAGGRCGTLHADKYNITEETGVQVSMAVLITGHSVLT